MKRITPLIAALALLGILSGCVAAEPYDGAPAYGYAYPAYGVYDSGYYPGYYGHYRRAHPGYWGHRGGGHYAGQGYDGVHGGGFHGGHAGGRH